MKKKLGFILMLVMVITLLAACGADKSANQKSSNTATNTTSTANSGSTDTASNDEVKVVHELGETTVKKNPQKVIVFDLGSLDTLDKLGVEVTGLPKDALPQYLSKYADDKYVNAGGLKEPDFEKINETKPDLIIISGRQSDAYAELSKIAPTIYMDIDQTKYMESFKKNVTTLAEIFSKEDLATTELASIDETINKVKSEATATQKKGLILLTTGGKISAYGPGSRFGIIHDTLGITPVDTTISAETHGQSVSSEYIAEQNPDYIFVVDRDAAIGQEADSAKQVIENELVKNTNAFKTGHIVYLEPGYWYLSGGGLESVAEMAKEIEAAIIK